MFRLFVLFNFKPCCLAQFYIIFHHGFTSSSRIVLDKANYRLLQIAADGFRFLSGVSNYEAPILSDCLL